MREFLGVILMNGISNAEEMDSPVIVAADAFDNGDVAVRTDTGDPVDVSVFQETIAKMNANELVAEFGPYGAIDGPKGGVSATRGPVETVQEDVFANDPAMVWNPVTEEYIPRGTTLKAWERRKAREAQLATISARVETDVTEPYGSDNRHQIADVDREARVRDAVSRTFNGASVRPTFGQYADWWVEAQARDDARGEDDAAPAIETTDKNNAPLGRFTPTTTYHPNHLKQNSEAGEPIVLNDGTIVDPTNAFDDERMVPCRWSDRTAERPPIMVPPHERYQDVATINPALVEDVAARVLEFLDEKVAEDVAVTTDELFALTMAEIKENGHAIETGQRVIRRFFHNGTQPLDEINPWWSACSVRVRVTEVFDSAPKYRQVFKVEDVCPVVGEHQLGSAQTKVTVWPREEETSDGELTQWTDVHYTNLPRVQAGDEILLSNVRPGGFGKQLTLQVGAKSQMTVLNRPATYVRDHSMSEDERTYGDAPISARANTARMFDRIERLAVAVDELVSDAVSIDAAFEAVEYAMATVEKRTDEKLVTEAIRHLTNHPRNFPSNMCLSPQTPDDRPLWARVCCVYEVTDSIPIQDGYDTTVVGRVRTHSDVVCDAPDEDGDRVSIEASEAREAIETIERLTGVGFKPVDDLMTKALVYQTKLAGMIIEIDTSVVGSFSPAGEDNTIQVRMIDPATAQTVKLKAIDRTDGWAVHLITFVRALVEIGLEKANAAA